MEIPARRRKSRTCVAYPGSARGLQFPGLLNYYREQPLSSTKLSSQSRWAKKETPHLFASDLLRPAAGSGGGFVADADPHSALLFAALGPEVFIESMTDPGALIEAGNWLRRSHDLERAILAYRKALEHLSLYDDPGPWAHTTAKLANALLARQAGDRSANVEEALALCRAALAQLAATELKDVLYSRTSGGKVGAAPEGVADLFHELGDAYAQRLEGDRAHNLDVALRAYGQALLFTNREEDPVDWAVEAMTLGTAISHSPSEDPEADRRRSIAFLQDALAVFIRVGDQARAGSTAHNLAVALLGVEGDNRREAVATAIKLLKELLEVRRRESDSVAWASATATLASAHLADPDADGSGGAAEAARLYEELLAEPALRADLRAEAFRNLALAYQQLGGDDPSAAKKMAAALRSALEHLPPGSPVSLRPDALHALANLYFEQRRWAKAEPFYGEAIELETRRLETAVYETGRRARLPADLHPRHAYCLLRRGRYDEALVQLEAGKTRLLALAVALTAARLESLDPDLRDAIAEQRDAIREWERLRERENALDRHRTRIDDAEFVAGIEQARAELTRLLAEARARRPGLDLDALSARRILALVPGEGALVAPVFTSEGSAVLVVPHAERRVEARHVLWLDDFTTADLAVLTKRISGGAEQAIEAVGEELWERLAGRIARRLRRAGARRVLLLPQGGLGLLPVHAAWHTAKGERRYLADEFEVRYAPSAYALDTARHAAGGRSRTALVAGVSRSERFGDLPSVDDEVEVVGRLLGAEPLVDSLATRAEIVRHAGDAAYVHLACHGAFGWGADPLESALYLAGDEPLTLADVIGRLELSSTRLVALSACESGVIEASESPDEFFGLTAGFMQAGAAGVLSTLWKVDDLSTGLLVERFYRNHLEGGAEPAAALAEAQQWLRGVTRERVSRQLREQGRRDESRDVLVLGRKEEKPYTHPYYWGAFAYNGV